jgi:MEMO1 family protein
MLVFSAITPHSPLLLPSVNTDKYEQVRQTTNAMHELADELYATRPDVIVLLSEHPTSYSDTFSINVSDPYRFDLSEFGNLGFRQEYRPAIMLIDRLQRSLRSQGQPITLTTDIQLHHASAVPLALLTKQLPHIKLVPITYSDLDAKKHFAFGQSLKDVLTSSPERIAVIASGDLSHALATESPAGFHKSGEKFDKKIQELVAQKNASSLVKLSSKLVEEAEQTIYRPLLILFGILDHISISPRIESYESPFGVGFLVSHMPIV